MLLREYPNTLVHTSGPSVGLPEGQMGNSEVGHLNIGAGRVIYMDVTRIDMMIASGEFFKNPVLLDAMQHARTHRLHLMGLCSDGGVHSLLTHLYALLKMAKQQQWNKFSCIVLWTAAIRLPRAAPAFSSKCRKRCAKSGSARSRSVSGRYYAMDRDKRWDRIERAFGAMVLGNGAKSDDPVAAVKRSYEQGVTDEFIEPVTIVDARKQPVGLIRDDDACIFFNYRADRGREMTMALKDPTLEKPSRSVAPKNLHFTTMTQYDKSFRFPSCLPREHPNNILADVMAQLNWKNLRVAETEKYAHVTYFFNGGKEEAVSRREPRNGAVAQGGDVRSEARDERRWDHGGGGEGHRAARFRRDRDELRECGYGGAFGEDGADRARGGSGRCGPG